MHIPGIPEPTGWADPLTGFEGPDAWQRSLVIEIARSARYQSPMTVVMLEVEGIVELGEDFGDVVSRHVLHEAADALRRESRATDLLFRIGLTKFGVLLAETDEVTAINYVERVRERVLPRLPLNGAGLRLSFGWASPRPGESADRLARRADGRMMRELLR